MKKLLAVWSVWQFVEAAVLIVLGVITICFAGNAGYRAVIVCVGASLILLDGLLRLAMFFAEPKAQGSHVGLIAGISELTFGVWLIILNSVIIDYIVLFISVGLLVIGVVLIIDGIFKCIRKAQKVIISVLQFVGAALLVAIGVVALVYYPYTGASEGADTITIMLICAGVILALAGVFVVGYTVAGLVNAKKAAKAKVEVTVEVHEKAREDKKEKAESKPAEKPAEDSKQKE